MKKHVKIVSLVGLLFSSNALAHAGHDHSHWSSEVLHFLTYASILAVAAGLGFAAFKYLSSAKKEQA